MENSKIEWTDHTFNPWVGCTKISPACDNCYAESWAKRAGSPGLWTGERRRTTPANWSQPIKWDRQAKASGVRRKVFCASLADVFDNQVPSEWRDDLFKMILATPNLDWLLLTKRPQNIGAMLPADWQGGYGNVWLGTTVENQSEALRRIPMLAAIPAHIRFLSCEPMLAPLLIDAIEGVEDLDWIICGGESGPGFRAINPEWARGLLDQCRKIGIYFFMKQMSGARKPLPPIPDDLLIRECPKQMFREAA